MDNVINSGGIKLIPEQIEENSQEKLIDDSIFTSKEDKVLGEKLIMVVEGEPFTIDDKIFDNLDKYQKPKEIVFVPEFKETISGKILRKKH
jgi:O-succinylbenzoic acid--CoA ligase